ncbi:MAG: carotenoid oxygenase family protein [Cyanobacteria bacterium P01_A01_bin.84]
MQTFSTSEITSTVSGKSYNRSDWQGGYQSLKEEFDYWIDNIEGEIPSDLNGTLFRNGPGLLEVGGQFIRHPFDGDGMISRITFTNQKAHFRNRYVRTEGYVEEQAADQILYRGVFGTQKPGGWIANLLDFKNKEIANTNVIYWGGKLLALWEASEPYCLNPKTLETMGKEYFNGGLSEGDSFSAHPRFDPNSSFDSSVNSRSDSKLDHGTPCLVNFSIKPVGLSTTITIYELDIQGNIIRKKAHSVPGFAFIHDFAITPNYCILFQNPVTFNPIPFVLGMRGAGECIKFQVDKPTRIIIIPRNSKAGEMRTLETNSGFVFHHANAFEKNDEIIVDSICYESLPEVEAESDFRQVDFEEVAPGQLWRFKINLTKNTVENKLIESRSCEFPSINPQNVGRDYRYIYIGATHSSQGNAPFQALLKVDLETGERQLWSAAPKGFAGEPIFVPRPNAVSEDDGWVLTLFYDAGHHRSYLTILDAKDFNKEPIAKLHLKHHVPYGLHGNFVSDVFI